MGNIHRLIQVTPAVCIDAAAVPIKSGFYEKTVQRFEKLKQKDHCFIKSAQIKIFFPNVNVQSRCYVDPNERFYVCVQSGSKHGYHEEMDDVLHPLENWLEDAVFYVDDEALGYIDECRVENGKYSRERVVEAGGDSIEYVARCYSGQKDIVFELFCSQAENISDWMGAKDAMRWIKKALKIKPNDPNANSFYGYLLNEIGEYDKAIAALNKAIDVWQPAPQKKFFNQSCEFTNDYNDKALEFFKIAYGRIGYSYSMLGQHEKAMEYYDLSGNLMPTWEKYHALTQAGVAYIKLKRFDAAIQKLGEVIRFTSSRNQLACALYSRACAYNLSGDVNRAMRDIGCALLIAPKQFEEMKDDEDLRGIDLQQIMDEIQSERE